MGFSYINLDQAVDSVGFVAQSPTTEQTEYWPITMSGDQLIDLDDEQGIAEVQDLSGGLSVSGKKILYLNKCMTRDEYIEGETNLSGLSSDNISFGMAEGKVHLIAKDVA